MSSTPSSQKTVKLDQFDRQSKVILFAEQVVKKIRSSDNFSEEEREATKYVAELVSSIIGGWSKSGAPRKGTSSKTARYFRFYRSRVALEAAEEASASPEIVNELRLAYRSARKDYYGDELTEMEKQVGDFQVASAFDESRKPKLWVIDVTEACKNRGIENPYQLWQKIGGSKQTTAQLFAGTSKMIQTETMNRLYNILGIAPVEYIIRKGLSD